MPSQSRPPEVRLKQWLGTELAACLGEWTPSWPANIPVSCTVPVGREVWKMQATVGKGGLDGAESYNFGFSISTVKTQPWQAQCGRWGTLGTGATVTTVHIAAWRSWRQELV